MEFENKVALVLGAARGIGKAYCQSLLERGAKVTFCDRLQIEGQRTEEEFQERYGADRVTFRRCDCSSFEELDRLFNDTLSANGTIDIVVCNIGTLNERKWKHTITLNMNVPIMACELTQWNLGKDKGGKGGVFVVTASMAAHNLLFIPVYGASKAGLVHYIRSASVPSEYQRHGIKMLALCPETVNTNFMDGISAETIRYHDIVCKNVKKRLEHCLSAEQVGDALVTCLSNDKLGAGAVVTINVDGSLKVEHYSSR